MSRIIYVAHYSDPHRNAERLSAPAAISKMDYLIGVMKDLGHEVEVWSLCEINERTGLLTKSPASRGEINGVPIRFFDRYSSRYKLVRGLLLRYSEMKIRREISRGIKKGDKVVVYHSLSSLHVLRKLRGMGVPFILEAEEIYSDVIGDRKLRRRELRHMRMADAYILPTALLSPEVNPGGRPEAIVHGVYRSEPKLDIIKFGDIPGERRIHCVYAGTFDPRKGGAAAAVLAAEKLPEDHHVHIIGFGTEKDTAEIKAMIAEVSKRSAAKLTYDGLLQGEDYKRFLQSCDIGLSTQIPDAAFSGTSFPSKILSYLSNGLRVVSVRVPAVETSAIGGSIGYYDEQTPQSIADAIMRVDVNDGHDPREELRRLSEDFEKDLKKVLESV